MLTPPDDPLAGVERSGEQGPPQAARPQLLAAFPPLAGHQIWSDLLFLHWPVPPAAVQALLPPQLTVDTWDGSAWVGLVPFAMRGVRPWWSPAVPGISQFLETNVRTYVHFRGRDPAVWFFSLDAANRLAVAAARTGWKLPYFHAAMSLTHAGNQLTYRSQRTGGWPSGPVPSPVPALHIEATVGNALPTRHADGRSGQAAAGSFEEFLVERYLLYTRSGAGLLRGHVAHEKYPLYEASNTICEQTLTAAAGLPCPGPPACAHFSPGVTVQVSRLVRVDDDSGPVGRGQ